MVFLQTLTSPIIHPNPSSRKHHFQILNTRTTTFISSGRPFIRVPNTTPTVIPDSGLLYREKIIYLETNLNVNSTKALQKNPNFRSTPISSLKSVEKCLSSMGIERSAFGRIFDMHPQLLSCDPYSDLYSVFDFLLNEVCVPYRDVRKCIVRCPRLLVSSVDHQLRPTLLFLKKLGFVGQHSISCQTSVLLVSSVEVTLMPKIHYLESLGFTYAEVVWMVVRSPALLTYSIENNFRPKVEFFFQEIRGDLVELKRFPQYFSFSLERKIKPRHRILVEHGLSLSLADMLKVSDGEFNARLIEMRLRTHSDKKLLISPGILKEQMVNIG